MHLTDYQADILRATRPAPIEVFILRERFGSNYSVALSQLMKIKLVQKAGESSVQITALGREHCSRRSGQVIKRASVKAVAA